MITKVTGILIRTIKYNDNSNIVTVITREYGKLTFFVRITNNKKNGSKKQILHPCYILNLYFNFQENKTIHNLIDVELEKIFLDIPLNINKISMVMLIAEILFATIKHSQTDDKLYNFIHNSLIDLDQNTQNYYNFHLIFLLNLCKFLGFEPKNNYSSQNPYFDLTEGDFKNYFAEETMLSKEQSHYFYLFANENNLFTTNYNINNSQRRTLLANILRYYSYHVEDLSRIKSLTILQQIFAE